MDNLFANSKNPADPRPHQLGKAEGHKTRLFIKSNVKVDKEWMVDTGASVSAITKGNADNFDLTPTGATASGTTGGGGIIMKKGLTMVFSVIDPSGISKDVKCSLAVGVKPNNSGSDILGMDQLADVNAKVEWNPRTQRGRLFE